MGQKVHPHGLRVGVIKDWDSRWYSKDEEFGDTLVSDYKLRKYLKQKLNAAGIPRIEIERAGGRVRVIIHCAKPGMIIGRGGTEIEKLRLDIENFLGIKGVSVNVNEVKNPDLNAQLVAENIASQLERRISFRRAMKLAIGRTMRLGARGIKISVSGRLGGAEIARTEHYHEGTIPLQTLRADIDYGFTEAKTTYGRIGVKVWIYSGEVLQEVQRDRPRKNDFNNRRPDRNDRGDRRPDRKGGFDRRGGGGMDRRPGAGGAGYRPQNVNPRRSAGFHRPAEVVKPAEPSAEGGQQNVDAKEV